MVSVPTWTLLPFALRATPPASYWGATLWLAAGAVLTTGGLILIWIGGSQLDDPEKMTEPRRSKVLYGRALVGLGFALLIDALVNTVALSGFAWSSGIVYSTSTKTTQAIPSAVDAPVQFEESFTDEEPMSSGMVGAESHNEILGRVFGRSKEESATIAMFLMLSMGVALLGALFFFATALWAKIGHAQTEPFDHSLFWGGLWFRVGEALIFTSVIFLFMRTYAPDQYLLLPLVSLLVGMFLKSGEALISGMASRVFEAFSVLFPTPAAAPKPTKYYRVEIPAEVELTQEVFDQIANAIKGLTGVRQINPVFSKRLIHVLYEPGLVTPERIDQEVLMLGLDEEVPDDEDTETDDDEDTEADDDEDQGAGDDEPVKPKGPKPKP